MNLEQSITSKKQDVFSLGQIASWCIKNEVSLPTIQRGFVWKPYQIENLWDSILRGYPLGAFVFAVSEEQHLELLDGQQRSTAISLGFGNDTFRQSLKHYRVFIDLDKPHPDDSRKFIIRVITRSHPWGYSKANNTSTLSVNYIRHAMNHYYGEADPINSPLDEFFPADAGLAIPLALFLDSAVGNLDLRDLLNKIYAWKHWKAVHDKWLEEISAKEEAEQIIEDRVAIIYSAVQRSLAFQKVPALYLDLNEQVENEESASEEAADEIETMFVRLNSGGTPLTGEELNYSILKAHISFDTQQKIEEGCKFLFRPARFITIAYRLFQHDGESRKGDALSMKIKPKQFQRSIVNEGKAKVFEDFLIALLDDKGYNGKTLLEYVLQTLAYSEKQTYALPYVLYGKLSDAAPELMFLLLHRIKNKGDLFTSGDIIHRKMLGMMCLMLWTGRGESLKDHSKLLMNIWPSAESETITNFWSSDTVQRARINDVLLPFPTLDGVDGIRQIFPNRVTDSFDLIKNLSKSPNVHFIARACYNRDLILFCQRSFLHNFFNDAQYQLEDTNLPFDWDHIFPHNLIRNKKNIPQALKNCYQMSGNFRAWPYELNRMDSDNLPAKKLNPLSKIHFEESHLLREKEKWGRFVKKYPKVINHIDELSEKLLDWSHCTSTWAAVDVQDIRKDYSKVVKQIISRNISMLEHWYEEHLIEQLMPVFEVDFKSIMDRKRWKQVDKTNRLMGSIDWPVEEFEIYLGPKTKIDADTIQPYVYYPITENACNLLKSHEIRFGYFNKDGNILPQMTGDNFIEKDRDWVENRFTLKSFNAASYNMLLNEFLSWTVGLSFPSHIEQEMINVFKGSFKSKFLNGSSPK